MIRVLAMLYFIKDDSEQEFVYLTAEKYHSPLSIASNTEYDKYLYLL